MKSVCPSSLYQVLVDRAEVRSDPDQVQALAALDSLFVALTTSEALPSVAGSVDRMFRRKASTPPTPKGVYLHGGPGRGKSMLMDLFFRSLPDSFLKRRVHFHAFMIEIHDALHAGRAVHAVRGGVETALPDLANQIAQATKILCFDEFHVTDVADAMILGRLFTALFHAGVCVVATSNWPPESLYEGGLQRDRFLPFISLLRERMEVIALDGGLDYRNVRFAQDGMYFTPLGEGASAKMDLLFAHLAGDALPEVLHLTVKGRVLTIPVFVRGVARMEFSGLCEVSLGAEDYLAIAKACHTLFLERVPRLSQEKRNEAKRLMTLIDVLYDQGIRLVVSAEAPPDQIYQGHDHEFEFSRTVSRLMEMQDPDWIEKRARTLVV